MPFSAPEQLLHTYFEVWLSKTTSHGNHGGCEGPGDPDGGEELRNVWGEPERDGSVGVEIPGSIVDVEPEIGHV